MNRRPSRILAALFLAVPLAALLQGAVAAPKLTELWTTDGFNNPESVIHDAKRKILYVSNVNGGGLDKDGNGYISRVDLKGKIVEQKWIDGLNAPKGLTMVGDKLFAADIDELIEIDLAKGAVAKRHAGKGAKFLNDVTADSDGNVYVSDMLNSQIYRLSKDGKFEVWLASEKLEFPNGLHFEKGKLLVGSWGKPNPDFTTDVPGHMKVVDLKTRAITPLGNKTKATGNLDGVEPDGAGNYFVTDWIAGKLFHITSDGVTAELLSLPSGAADLEFIAGKDKGKGGLLVIPLMKTSKLKAFRISEG